MTAQAPSRRVSILGRIYQLANTKHKRDAVDGGERRHRTGRLDR